MIAASRAFAESLSPPIVDVNELHFSGAAGSRSRLPSERSRARARTVQLEITRRPKRDDDGRYSDTSSFPRAEDGIFQRCVGTRVSAISFIFNPPNTLGRGEKRLSKIHIFLCMPLVRLRARASCSLAPSTFVLRVIARATSCTSDVSI